jgi:nitrogen regulatory protein PII
MKKIEAFISPESMSSVSNVLEARRVTDFMFSNVIGRSTNGTHHCVYRGNKYEVELDPEVKLETVVRDDEASELAYAILKAAGGSQASCKPRVLLAPVNQVVFQVVEPALDANQSTKSLMQPVERLVKASERIANAINSQPVHGPARVTMPKLPRSVPGFAREDRSNAHFSLATRIVFGRGRRRPWLFSLRPAHR